MDSEKIDAVVLCALPVEYRAMRKRLVHLREVAHPAGTIYETGKLRGGNGATVGLVEVGQGNPAAASSCERAIAYFQPAVALFVGVAGGLKDVGHGDVVAADRILNYESGKQAAEYLPRIASHWAASAIVEQARAVARSSGWARRRTGQLSLPKAVVGPIAAGEKVVASQHSSLREFLAKNCSEALAVEMEGYGFLHAAWTNAQVGALVVRGISDLLDKSPEQDLAWQEIASENAATFAVALLSRLTFETPVRVDSLTALLNSPALQEVKASLDAARDPVADIFDGIGSASELTYGGRDFDFVTVRAGEEYLDIYFDTIFHRQTPLGEAARREIDDYVREINVHGALIVTDGSLDTGDPVAGGKGVRSWTISGSPFTDVDDQLVVAVTLPEADTALYRHRLTAARDMLRDVLTTVRAEPSSKRQLYKLIAQHQAGTPAEHPADPQPPEPDDHQAIHTGWVRVDGGGFARVHAHVRCAPSRSWDKPARMNRDGVYELLSNVCPDIFPSEADYAVPDELIRFMTPDTDRYDPAVVCCLPNGVIEFNLPIRHRVTHEGPVISVTEVIQLIEAIRSEIAAGAYRQIFGLQPPAVDWMLNLSPSITAETFTQEPWIDMDFPGRRPAGRAVGMRPPSDVRGYGRAATQSLPFNSSSGDVLRPMLTDLLERNGYHGSDEAIEDILSAAGA